MKNKIVALALGLIFVMATALSVSAVTVPGERLRPRLVDEGDLLSDQERDILLEKLDAISVQQRCDIVIVTAKSLNGVSAQNYADDFFDANGYGLDFSADRDGILLLYCPNEDVRYVSTHGFGIVAITDTGLQYIGERVRPLLDDGEIMKGFETFVGLCNFFLAQAKENTPVEGENLSKEPLGIGWILFALVAGLIIALIVTGIWRGQMKSVRSQAAASSYLKEGSMKLTHSTDLFLYRTVDRRVRPKSNSGSGGSSTHRSSSGSTHGGGSF